MRLVAAGPVLLLFLMPLAGQSGHILYGDFSVDESGLEKKAPQTFQLVLRNIAEVILGRETVSPGSQYRFSGISNGEYSLAVELGGLEVARQPVYVMGLSGSYIRHDIQLAWTNIQLNLQKPVSRPIVYVRSADRQSLFDNAEREQAANNLSQATHFLEQLLQEDPKDFEAWTELGSIFFHREMVEEAAAAYRAALKVRPNYSLARLNLGKLYLSHGDYEEAVSILQEGLSQSEPLPAFYYFLGEAHLRLKEGSKAVEYFRNALEKQPQQMADAHLRLGALYDAAGYKELAADEYQEYLQKRPDSSNRAALEDYIRMHNKQPQSREER